MFVTVFYSDLGMEDTLDLDEEYHGDQMFTPALEDRDDGIYLKTFYEMLQRKSIKLLL